jgi:hypothetical protein
MTTMCFLRSVLDILEYAGRLVNLKIESGGIYQVESRHKTDLHVERLFVNWIYQS